MNVSTFRPSAPASPNGSSPSGVQAPAVGTGGGRRAAAPRLSPPARRRRPALLALGVALAAAGGLTAATLTMRAGERVPVLAVARTVEVGSVLTANDLTEARLPSDPNLAPIPAEQLSSVVGQVAAVPLRPGTLLTRGELTTTSAPAAGTQLLGVLLKPGHLPARPLAPGQPVLVVPTRDEQSSTGASSSGMVSPVAATVVDVGGVAQDGSVTVDVSVAAAMGPVLARQAVTGNVAVIAVAAGGR